MIAVMMGALLSPKGPGWEKIILGRSVYVDTLIQCM